MDLPPIPPPESANTSLVAQPTDVGNLSNVHKTIDSARGEKEDIRFDKSSNIRVESQPKNSTSIPQSQPAKVTSIAQQNKTLVKTVKPALKPLNHEMPTTLTATQNDEAGMVCVVCQINLPNIEAYKNHMSDIKHKMTIEKFSTKAVGGGHVKIVTRRIKKEK